MSTYPTAGADQYHGNDPQHDAFHDPPQFELYNPHPPEQTHDRREYREPYEDEPSDSLSQGQSTDPLGPTYKEEVSYYSAEAIPVPPRPRTSRNLRAWRYQQGRRLWTQGSRPRCLCRFFCCTFLITIFLVATIAMCLALWIRPPDILLGGDNPAAPIIAQGINVLSDGFQINFGLPIEVINPNYFTVKLVHVNADIIYPINNTHVGGGSVNNVNLKSHARTKFTFPFAILYTTSVDPSTSIISDIASKCLASPQTELTIDYKINIGVRVFFITISPTISNPISLPCPLPASQLQQLISQLGLKVGSGSS